MDFIDRMLNDIDLELAKKHNIFYKQFCKEFFDKVYYEIEKRKLNAIEVMEYIGNKLY